MNKSDILAMYTNPRTTDWQTKGTELHIFDYVI